MEIQDVIAYLRVIAFNDDLSFKRIINTPRRQFGRVRVAALETMRENNERQLKNAKNSVWRKNAVSAMSPLPVL